MYVIEEQASMHLPTDSAACEVVAAVRGGAPATRVPRPAAAVKNVLRFQFKSDNPLFNCLRDKDFSASDYGIAST